MGRMTLKRANDGRDVRDKFGIANNLYGVGQTQIRTNKLQSFTDTQEGE